MTRTAHSKFQQVDSTSPKLMFREGEYAAFVTIAFGDWAWTVWYRGSALDGRTANDMDVYLACDEAMSYIASMKDSETRRADRFWNMDAI